MAEIVRRGRKRDKMNRPKLVVTYDPKNGQKLADGRLEEEFEDLVRAFKDYDGMGFTITRTYANFIGTDLVRLLYTRGFVNYDQIFCRFSPNAEPTGINEFAAWTSPQRDFGRAHYDITHEILTFAVKKRRENTD